MKNRALRTLYEVLQLLAALLWVPFQVVAQVGHLVNQLATRTGNALARPVYWGIVRAKRRALGDPPWYPRDWKIGIGPPCGSCGRNVPPERHAGVCRDLAPAMPTHRQDRAAWLGMYLKALRDEGVDVDGEDLHLGRVLSAVVDDARGISKEIGHGVLWDEAAEACRRLAEEISARKESAP